MLTSIRDVEKNFNAVRMDRRAPKANPGDEGDDENFVDLAYPYNTSVMYELMALSRKQSDQSHLWTSRW